MSLALLKQAAERPMEDYDPDEIVAAVNFLQPRGKERALAQLEELLATLGSGDNTGLFWVLRALFDLQTGVEFPPVMLGQPSIPPPSDLATLPRYPIVIAQDIPLLAIRGYLLGGLPERVETHLAYFRTHGVIRSRLLNPHASVNTVEQNFLRQWRAAYGEAHLGESRETIRQQLNRLHKARQ